MTRDGVEMTLLANIGTPGEAAPARALGARGVGLFRTEFLFLERSTPPSEDEQAAAYREVVEAFEGDPVTIRLLDIGGDKPIPYLPMPPEDNPFLGVRALRLALDRPEIFVTQLRACYRAAVAGPVKVMAPMVADAGDAALLLDLAARARDGLRAEGVPFADVDLGVMLEIPSAILAADAYFGTIAFASLGTNDLTQYALAVDRGNPALERYRDAMHPAVLRLIAMAAESADRAGHLAVRVRGDGWRPRRGAGPRRAGSAAAVDGGGVAARGPAGDPLGRRGRAPGAGVRGARGPVRGPGPGALRGPRVACMSHR